MFHVVLYSVVSYLLYTVVDQLPRLGKRELVFLLLFTCSFVVSVLGRFLFLLVLGMDCAFLLWHSLGLPLIIFQKGNRDNSVFFSEKNLQPVTWKLVDADNKST